MASKPASVQQQAKDFAVSAPGKVIVVGEHAVVHGKVCSVSFTIDCKEVRGKKKYDLSSVIAFRASQGEIAVFARDLVKKSIGEQAGRQTRQAKSSRSTTSLFADHLRSTLGRTGRRACQLLHGLLF